MKLVHKNPRKLRENVRNKFSAKLILLSIFLGIKLKNEILGFLQAVFIEKNYWIRRIFFYK